MTDTVKVGNAMNTPEAPVSTEDVEVILKEIGDQFPPHKPVTLPADAGYLAKLLTDNFDFHWASETNHKQEEQRPRSEFM